MNITKRLYSYPVLCDDNDDYIACSFGVDYTYSTSNLNEIEFDFNFSLDCDDLEELIESRQAEFMVHVECSQTAYRKVFRSFAKKASFEIPLKQISGKLEIVALIVARTNIENFNSGYWNPDYDGMSISLCKGTILAYQNIDSLQITKDYEEFINANSIISVVKRHSSEPIPAEVELEGDRIKIYLFEKDYDSYIRLSKAQDFQTIVNTSTVLPALVYTFDLLKNEDDLSKYSDKNWFVSLKTAFSKRNLDFEDELLSDKTGYVIAQEVMELPLVKMYESVDALSNNVEEGEDD